MSAIPAFAGGLALPAQTPTDRRLNRLTARPGATPGSDPGSGAAQPGLHPLGLRPDRDALLYIPESAAKHEKAPLIVSLHGANRNADRGIELLRSLSDEHGFLLLAPASEDGTWDAIFSPYGPDVDFINHSLARTFELRKVDPARIAMAGFSDGASYSLSIGLANDPVLPIEVCSRRIVPGLQRAGYRVTYREFEGKHTLPPEVASEAMQWFMAMPPA